VSFHLQGLRVSFVQILRSLRGALAIELLGTSTLHACC